MKPNDPNAGRCRDCRFWWPGGDEWGKCRRRAPRMVVDSDNSIEPDWVWTNATDGCGEFQPIPKTDPDVVDAEGY